MDTSRTGTVKTAFSSIILTPRIKRKHLRKYSWLPDVLRVKNTIIKRIAGPVLTVTLFAVLICYMWSKGQKVALPNSIVPLLSVVVGLILVFRNSTSYDRYWEGRKCFSSMTSHVRNFARLTWVNVGLPPAGPAPSGTKGKTPSSDVTEHQLHRRKVEALKLALAFAFAVKHYLRGEEGTEYEDYIGVLPPSFARFDEIGYNTQKTVSTATYAATERANSLALSDGSLSGRSSPDGSRTGTNKRLRVKRSNPNVASPTTPLLRGTHRSVQFHPYADEASLPLPLVIAHELARIIYGFRRDGFLETVGPAGTNSLNQVIQSMVNELSSMERVANTPIPKACVYIIPGHSFQLLSALWHRWYSLEAMCHPLPLCAPVHPHQ
ncbi:hypothetical protein HGRIS_013260 [Hohenbuehelia grisea]|uniref:Uncharacterized protein n=1 Tax=Hohenbuehelia grisea TaxID=104357 RepID=A0ABR3IV43_9AGAR